MLIESMIICSLTLVAPFYDCDQPWIIQIYDEHYITQLCNAKDDNVIGCAHYASNPAYDSFYIPTIKLGSSQYIDEWGQTNVEHEIRHIMCRCNYHE